MLKKLSFGRDKATSAATKNRDEKPGLFVKYKDQNKYEWKLLRGVFEKLCHWTRISVDIHVIPKYPNKPSHSFKIVPINIYTLF